MTPADLLAIKARYGSLSPAHLQKIRACSEAAYKLVMAIPELLGEIEKSSKEKEASAQTAS